MLFSPLIRFGTSTWTYEGWQGQVYLKKYAKSTNVWASTASTFTTVSLAFARSAMTPRFTALQPRISFDTT